MAYKLRFVQRFRQGDTSAFLELERKFMELEQTVQGFPSGKRFLPCMGKEPQNTLIWEAEFPSLDKAVQAVSFLESNALHQELYDRQLQYFQESYTEIYKSLEK